MTRGIAPPSIGSEFSSLKRRVDALERKLNDLLGQFKPEIVFSYSGALATSSSPTWTRREAGRLIEVHARLRVAGTTATEIDILRNDVVELTVTIPANQTYMKSMTSLYFAPDQDVLHDEITVVGSGAVDLTVMHRFNH